MGEDCIHVKWESETRLWLCTLAEAIKTRTTRICPFARDGDCCECSYNPDNTLSKEICCEN